MYEIGGTAVTARIKSYCIAMLAQEFFARTLMHNTQRSEVLCIKAGRGKF